MKSSPARIAVIEDDTRLRPILVGILSGAGYQPEVFASGDEFLASKGPQSFDVVVTDFQMEGASGLDVLKACRAQDDPPEVLLVTGHGSIRNAVEAIRLGALDYLTKPVDPPELLHRIGQAVESRRLKREVDALSGEVRRRQGGSEPVGQSPAMREFLTRASRAAATSSTVLMLGETGTGKDVIARHIQATGPRSERTYLTVNCAALPEQLLESELFGHARGAFSGAHSLKRGLFEEADGGTLFLDEIGAMSLPAQAKLLRALEEGAVRRVGETQSIPVDVRILCATNRDLKDAVSRGEFRDDLFYRLSVVTLVVPTLRDRPEDIEPLARHFLAESVRRLGKLRVFAPETVEFLRGYSYPGNVRELRYSIEQAVILSEDGILRPEDFRFGGPLERAERRGSAKRLRSQPISVEITPERLEQALRESAGNRVRAARALNISRATLYRLLGRTAEVDSDRERVE
jgi:two-component system, NtrC family, response regulator HydG